MATFRLASTCSDGGKSIHVGPPTFGAKQITKTRLTHRKITIKDFSVPPFQ